MRVAASGKELLGQRDGGEVITGGLAGGVQRAGTWGQNLRTSVGLLHANAGRSCKHKLMPRFALSSKSVIRGVLRQHPSEIGFRGEVLGRGERVQGEIASLRAF